MKCIILCGGNGTRLWPASTKNKPKQFIPLISVDGDLTTLLDLTIQRVSDLGEIILLSNEKFKHLIPDIYTTILEPNGRDTAAAVISAALLYKSENILIIPSDHHIPDKNNFKTIIEQGLKIIQNGYICTFGINPTYPETGFGYIKLSDLSISGGYLVDKFTEKPDFQTAKSYISGTVGKYNWNSGILLFRAIDMIEEAMKYCPDIYQSCLDSINSDKSLNINYLNIRSQSIDYAILEKSKKIAVLPCNIIWDDIGSWNAVNKYYSPDDDDLINIDSKDCLTFRTMSNSISSFKKPLVMYGCDNLAYIETDNITLIFPLHKSQDIKKILKNIPEYYH